MEEVIVDDEWLDLGGPKGHQRIWELNQSADYFIRGFIEEDIKAPFGPSFRWSIYYLDMEHLFDGLDYEGPLGEFVFSHDTTNLCPKKEIESEWMWTLPQCKTALRKRMIEIIRDQLGNLHTVQDVLARGHTEINTP